VTTLDDFVSTATAARGLAVVSTLHGDSISSSVVSVGVLPHPTTHESVVGLVARSDSRKANNVRRHPRATLIAVAGSRWVAVEGPVTLIGPDDPLDSLDARQVAQLLREVYSSAGGHHPDWDEYDRSMREQRRTAMLVTPSLVYTNPGA
jgi:hypothetical protein